jgi:ATP-dependent Clp protease ATP-binding subunit ClpA
MLRFEKMTVKAQEALQQAQEVAARHENQQIEALHLLAALAAREIWAGSPHPVD